MKRTLLLVGALLLGAAAAAAQNVPRPDCIIDITLTAAGQSAGGQNTCGLNINGVYEWRLTYKSVGFTAISLLVQSAPPDVNGVCTAAVWVAFAGTIETGINPNTATTNASSSFKGFYPCVRVTLTSVMGAGTVTGQLYGCRSPGCSISDQSISVVIPTPVPVDGPTAAGSAPTTPPVLVAGQDGTPGVIRTLKTDALGQLIPANASSADADGVSNTQNTENGAGGGILYPRVFGRVFNGTTWDRMRGTVAGVFVQGPVADGVASTANPAIVGGVDQLGVARHFSTSPAGDIAIGSQVAGADAQANNWNFTVGGTGGTTAPLAVFGGLFNGATWDRIRGNTSGASPSNASSAGVDSVSNTNSTPTDSASTILYYRNLPLGFNGTSFDRLRTAALANLTPATTLTARNSIGAPLGGERGGRWTVVSTPAAGTVASASIALEAGVRHVADHICFSAQATGAVAATAVGIVIRDGATGAGTVILQFTAAIPVAAGTGQQEVAPFCSPAMDLVGTTATAMTAEFNTGVTNLVESVTLTGYNVN